MRYIYDVIEELSQYSPEELSKILTKKAHTDSHDTFKFIASWSEYKATKQYLNILESIVQNATISRNTNLNKYLDKIKTFSNLDGDLELLLIVKSSQVCIDYFTKEYELVKDLTSEFWYYVFSGHILDIFIFDRERSEEDMYDHRYYKMEIKDE